VTSQKLKFLMKKLPNQPKNMTRYTTFFHIFNFYVRKQLSINFINHQREKKLIQKNLKKVSERKQIQKNVTKR
jgi:hypothetical protein